MKYKRIFLIIMDALGVGEAIDADKYNDKGANTLGNLMNNVEVFIPNLNKLGLLNTLKMNNEDAEAYYTIARPKNKERDCLSGHYEIMGIESNDEYNYFNYGPFPRDLLEKIASTLQKPIVGNIVSDAKGAITKLYKRHMEIKSLIIYTTGDSNLEVAAEESIISVNDLYDCCEKIRQITTQNNWKVTEVVARPFRVENDNIILLDDSRIYTMPPNNTSVLDSLKEFGLQTISIGKISELFNGNGITKIIKASNNVEAVNKMIDIMNKSFEGLCFVNLNDLNTFFGRGRDIQGYKESLEEFDVQLPLILNQLNIDDILIITSDHGCDPTFPNNNHTRENVPVLIYSRNFISCGQIDILDTLADIGATIADNFGVEKPWLGTSFLSKLK